MEVGPGGGSALAVAAAPVVAVAAQGSSAVEPQPGSACGKRVSGSGAGQGEGSGEEMKRNPSPTAAAQTQTRTHTHTQTQTQAEATAGAAAAVAMLLTAAGAVPVTMAGGVVEGATSSSRSSTHSLSDRPPEKNQCQGQGGSVDASAAVPQASGHSLLPSAGGALVSYTVSDCGTQGALQTLQSDGSAPVPHAGSGAGGHSTLQADSSAAVIAAEALQALQARQGLPAVLTISVLFCHLQAGIATVAPAAQVEDAARQSDLARWQHGPACTRHQAEVETSNAMPALAPARPGPGPTKPSGGLQQLISTRFLAVAWLPACLSPATHPSPQLFFMIQ